MVAKVELASLEEDMVFENLHMVDRLDPEVAIHCLSANRTTDVLHQDTADLEHKSQVFYYSIFHIQYLIH